MKQVPKVWVIKEQMIRGEIQPIPMDYSPAMEFGELDFITAHDMPMYSKSSVQEQWNKQVDRFVTEYNEQSDFIITTGQPMAIFCVGLMLGRANKSPSFLVWRNQESKYRVVRFDAKHAESIA